MQVATDPIVQLKLKTCHIIFSFKKLFYEES